MHLDDVAGLAVQPVVWIATGSTPDAADSFLYGVGIGGVALGGGLIISIPAAVTGVVKGLVDDHTQGLVDEAKADERSEVRNCIYPVGDYSFWASGGFIQATTIASYGGTVWQHPNGAWCFIRDSNRRLVCDFEPRRATRVFGPNLPLRPQGDRYAWRTRRG